MIILGVDPGVNGATALWDGTTLITRAMPKTKSKGRGWELNVAELVDDFDLLFCGADHAFIELVNARPQEGGASSFKFGYAAGVVRGLVVSQKVPVTMVTPQTWKSKLRLTKDKDYSRTRALELFPSNANDFKLKKDNDKAEASLLAFYGRQEMLKESS